MKANKIIFSLRIDPVLMKAIIKDAKKQKLNKSDIINNLIEQHYGKI